MNPASIYTRTVELRSHPKMSYQGRPNWPPAWSGPSGSDIPKGEVGVLIKVEGASKYLTAPHCFLVIHWNNQEYFGALFFDDENFADTICNLLTAHLGSPMSVLGGLDLP
jgi:hypothetical protein